MPTNDNLYQQKYQQKTCKYLNCDQNVKTLFCETPGEHQEWPDLNKVMIDFFLDS